MHVLILSQNGGSPSIGNTSWALDPGHNPVYGAHYITDQVRCEADSRLLIRDTPAVPWLNVRTVNRRRIGGCDEVPDPIMRRHSSAFCGLGLKFFSLETLSLKGTRIYSPCICSRAIMGGLARND